MTRNQIEYWRLVEAKRSNMANERYNQQFLQHQKDVLALNYATLNETIRSNKAREKEATRHSLQQYRETVRQFNASITLQQQQLSETLRRNRAVEKQQAAALAETHRSNVAVEQLKAELNQLQRDSVAEVARANRAQEAARQKQLDTEVFRAVTDRSVREKQIAEQMRSNLAAEANRASILSLNYAQLAEQRRHSTAIEGETARSNRARELLTLSGQGLKASTDILNSSLRMMPQFLTTGR
nr:putative ORF1 [Marmot picobirnavirus]